MAATNKKVEQLTLIQKSEFPVVMGDTAQCSYTAELHFFLCGKAIDDSITKNVDELRLIILSDGGDNCSSKINEVIDWNKIKESNLDVSRKSSTTVRYGY